MSLQIAMFFSSIHLGKLNNYFYIFFIVSYVGSNYLQYQFAWTQGKSFLFSKYARHKAKQICKYARPKYANMHDTKPSDKSYISFIGERW